MRDPDLTFKAQMAASALERAWGRWRVARGLDTDPAPAVSSYVGYSLDDPWGQPRVVFGLTADEAEHLAALLEGREHIDAGSLRQAAPASAGRRDHGVQAAGPRPLPVPPQEPAINAEQSGGRSMSGRSALPPEAQAGRRSDSARDAHQRSRAGRRPGDGGAPRRDAARDALTSPATTGRGDGPDGPVYRQVMAAVEAARRRGEQPGKDAPPAAAASEQTVTSGEMTDAAGVSGPDTPPRTDDPMAAVASPIAPRAVTTVVTEESQVAPAIGAVSRSAPAPWPGPAAPGGHGPATIGGRGQATTAGDQAERSVPRQLADRRPVSRGAAPAVGQQIADASGAGSESHQPEAAVSGDGVVRAAAPGAPAAGTRWPGDGGGTGEPARLAGGDDAPREGAAKSPAAAPAALARQAGPGTGASERHSADVIDQDGTGASERLGADVRGRGDAESAEAGAPVTGRAQQNAESQQAPYSQRAQQSSVNRSARAGRRARVQAAAQELAAAHAAVDQGSRGRHGQQAEADQPRPRPEGAVRADGQSGLVRTEQPGRRRAGVAGRQGRPGSVPAGGPPDGEDGQPAVPGPLTIAASTARIEAETRIRAALWRSRGVARGEHPYPRRAHDAATPARQASPGYAAGDGAVVAGGTSAVGDAAAVASTAAPSGIVPAGGAVVAAGPATGGYATAGPATAGHTVGRQTVPRPEAASGAYPASWTADTVPAPATEDDDGSGYPCGRHGDAAGGTEQADEKGIASAWGGPEFDGDQEDDPSVVLLRPRQDPSGYADDAGQAVGFDERHDTGSVARRGRVTRGYPIPRLPRAKRSGALPGT